MGSKRAETNFKHARTRTYSDTQFRYPDTSLDEFCIKMNLCSGSGQVSLLLTLGMAKGEGRNENSLHLHNGFLLRTSRENTAHVWKTLVWGNKPRRDVTLSTCIVSRCTISPLCILGTKHCLYALFNYMTLSNNLTASTTSYLWDSQEHCVLITWRKHS